MNNRFFASILFITIFLFSFPLAFAQAAETDFYEIKIYHIQDEEQEELVDIFLEKAYIPALHHAGVDKIGVFKPVEEDSLYGKRIYVFSPYTSAEEFMQIRETLKNDEEYKSSGREFLDAPYDNPPFERYETILLTAFEAAPDYTPNNLQDSSSERVYELRSYESATENLFRNKVKMFNKGEIEIFDRLKFNPIFYGEVIAGSHMPNLMYMTSFPNMASRDAHWEAFGSDPTWKELSSQEEYQNNVSHANIFLLTPTSYSDL